MKTKSILVFLFFLFVKQSQAQTEQIKFYASAQPSVLAVGQTFTLSFTLTNFSASDIELPNLNDFSIVGGPNKSVSVQSVNGDWKQVTEYSYVLMPRKSGKFSIQSATVKTKKGILKTNPIIVEINDAKQSTNTTNNGVPKNFDTSNNYFIQVITDKPAAFIGEQVLVDFVFYTKVPVQDFRVMEEPGFLGSYAQELKFYNEPQSQQKINGKNYIRKLIKRYAVFPQTAGEVEIQPMTLEVNILSQDNDPFSGFFGHETETKYCTSKKTSFKSNLLPNPAPSDFIGAVGNWKIDLVPTTTQISKNDALSLIMTLEGDGDVKNIQIPNLSFSPDFEMYAPKVVEENTSENNGRLISKKVFEFLLVPKNEGHHKFSAQISFFDINKRDFDSKTFGPFSIIVDKIKKNENSETEMENDNNSFNLIPTLKKYLAWLAGIIISISLIWLVFTLRGKKRQKPENIKSTTLTQLTESPKQKLSVPDPSEGLQFYIDQADQQTFYGKLQQNINQYLIQKLNISNTGVTNSEIIKYLNEFSNDQILISKVKTIFSTCEQVLYAGQDKSAMMQLFMEYLKEIKHSLS